MRAWYIWIPLWLLYLIYTGNFEWRNFLAGFVIALVVTALIRPRSRKIQLRRLPGALLALGRYLLLLGYNLVSGGFQVARIVLNPSLSISPGIIAIPTGCRSELSLALSAHALSVSPGELVVEIDDQGVMYTHVLDASPKSAYVYKAQQIRENLLRKIFI